MDRSLKLLLTMLAVLTGLTAVPAQARMCAVDASEQQRVESAPRGGISAIAATIADAGNPTALRERRERELGKTRPPARTVRIPTIQYGDRARE